METEILKELVPAIGRFELWTIESATIGILCLIGKENEDWAYLGSRNRINWQLN